MAEIATGAGVKVAEDISTNVLNFLRRQAGYLFNYRDNVMMLVDCKKKLEDKKDEAHKFINHAQQNFKEAVPSVVRWHTEAEEMSKQVAAFLNKEAEVKNNICQTPWSRYSLGREAFKLVECVNAKLNEAPAIDKLAYDVAPPNPGSAFNLGAVKDFNSRLSLMDKVLKALEDDKLSIIGICGIGGVGKTTMAKQLVKHVETKKLFKVAFTTVSQAPNLEKIQSDIVSCLGFEFNIGESKQNRRSKLHQKIMESNERILLVLDDVWPTLNFEDFEEIGIPSQTERCKILLTSRTTFACNKLGSQKNFPVDTLSKQEGFELFKKMAGNPTDRDLVKIAESIADECGGIPIAIVTVANSLRNKADISIWEGVLLQLQKYNPGGIFEMEEKVHYPIKLTYDLLQTQVAKSCFLLCSLFPEDFNIPIEWLVIYGIGLGFLSETDDFQTSRKLMRYFIDQLKDSFLLLNGDGHDSDESVKMHDVVRDVAISITSKAKHKYMALHDAIMKKWPHKNCVGISIKCEEMKEHPSGLEYPYLQVLLLEYVKESQCLPNNFFEGMKGLKVLSIHKLRLLPKSLHLLKNLTTLYLLNFDGEDISMVGALTNLQVVEIGGRCVTTLPKELGYLENLRLLDIRGMKSLQYIPGGILSKLARLEELYVCGSFAKWDNESNTSLSELESCPITALGIRVETISQFPSILLEKIRKFYVVVGLEEEIIGRGSMNIIYFEGELEMGHETLMGYLRRSREMKALLRRTEIFYARRMKDFQHIINEQQADGFPRLKKLSIGACTLEHLVDTNSKNLQLGRRGVIKLPCFSNLRDIELSRVWKLKKLFPLSMAKELKQVERISICHSKELRGIFCRTEVDDDENVATAEIEFPKLTEIYMHDLESLIGFWVDMEIKEDVSLSSQQEYNWFMKIPLEIPSSFQNLRKIYVGYCPNLSYVFSPHVVKFLVSLEEIGIQFCDRLAAIVAAEEEEQAFEIVFPKLRHLSLINLYQLRSFVTGGGTYSLKFPLLEDLYLSTLCMPTFCNGSVSTPKLKEIKIGRGNHNLRGDLNATLQDLEGEMLANIKEWEDLSNAYYNRS